MIWSFLFPSVRRQERERFLFFFSLAGLLTMGQTLGLVGAESLLLSQLGASVLPAVFVVASVVTVLASLLYAVGVDSSRNDNYFVRLLGIFAGLVALATWLQGAWPPARSLALVALFCLYYANFAICTNHFWTFTGDFFDTLGSKRLFPLFTVGSSLGGLAGGLLASLLASRAGGATVLLWGWVVCSLLAALWLRSYRGSLRRWGPLEIEEADETSMEGLRSSLRYLRNSVLGRLMVLSALFMVTSLFVSQYLYSTIFLAAFPEPDRLASFFGRFLAAANALELVLELAITPWLLRRFGIAHANLLHPGLTLVAFGWLALAPGLGAALFARLNRETLENAVAAPVRNLLFNALPARLRGRMRAFLEGMVVYSGMAVAGLVLMIWEGGWSSAAGATTLLSMGGMGLAFGFLLTNWRIKSEYLEQLVLAISRGRLDLSHSSSTLETLPPARLLELWDTLSVGSPRGTILEQVSQALLERRMYEPLVRGLQHPEVRFRSLCLQALQGLGSGPAQPYLRLGLQDSSPVLRLFALRHLPPTAQDAFRAALLDEDARVRAEAAARCLPVEESVLQSLLGSELPEEREAALSCLPPTLLEGARRALGSPHPGEVRAALVTLCRWKAAPPFDELVQLFDAGSAAVRQQALQAAVSLAPEDSSQMMALLSRALGDPDRSVRQTSVELFLRQGEAARSPLEMAVASSESHTCQSAIQALAELGSAEVRPFLAQESVRRAKRCWLHALEAARWEREGAHGLSERFLVLALRDAAARDLAVCFRLLEVLEEPKIVRSVEKVLRFAHARIRADALEVLSNLGVRESTAILVHLLEEGDLIEREQALAGRVPPPRERPKLLAQLESSPDRWLRLAAYACLSEQGRTEAPGGDDEGREERTLMEHLLMLQSVPLFATMTLEQLEAIHRCLSEQHYTLGEMIFAQGDVGDEMYIVVEGEVEILMKTETADPFLLSRVGPGSYFGEMSVLDNEPRSAGARVSQDARLLVLKGEQLKELVYVMPEIAFTIFRVLSQRLRRSDKRLDTLVRERKEEGGAPAS